MIEWSSLRRWLIRKLMRLGESEADAEDLVQEASVRLLEYSKEKVVLSIEAFMDRTANNLAIDRHRQRLRHPHENEDVLSLEQRLPLVSQMPNPHEVLAAKQRLSEIRGALNELLERTGDIFVLHRAGYSYKELAAEFELSESAIEKRIARAMLWLMDQKE